MRIVGELINASRKAIKAAIEAEDADAIARVAVEQAAAGADYIDVNAGLFGDREPDYLKWLVRTVQAAVDRPCCIDSPSPAAIEAALSVHRGVAMINSISLEPERLDALLPVIKGRELEVVALCMSGEGMPRTADDRVAIAGRLISTLEDNGVLRERIHVDPLVQPVATDAACGPALLSAVERIMTGFPGVHTLCGLSNVSYGLPERVLLNRTFLVMAVSRGLDGAILNPTDRATMAAIAAAETLAGKDDFCARYLDAYRSGALG